MHARIVLAVAAILAASAPALAQVVELPPVIPAADQWRDIPTLAPAVTDPDTRARMNAEIVQVIIASDGDQLMMRAGIVNIVQRYQDNALPQGARTRPGPK
jgi:hypothetical protein